MALLKQIEANRRNAQRSTGPKTDAGKERSRNRKYLIPTDVQEALAGILF